MTYITTPYHGEFPGFRSYKLRFNKQPWTWSELGHEVCILELLKVAPLLSGCMTTFSIPTSQICAAHLPTANHGVGLHYPTDVRWGSSPSFPAAPSLIPWLGLGRTSFQWWDTASLLRIDPQSALLMLQPQLVASKIPPEHFLKCSCHTRYPTLVNGFLPKFKFYLQKVCMWFHQSVFTLKVGNLQNCENSSEKLKQIRLNLGDYPS